mgnify:FL=1
MTTCGPYYRQGIICMRMALITCKELLEIIDCQGVHIIRQISDSTYMHDVTLSLIVSLL